MTIALAEKKAKEIVENYKLNETIPFDPVKLAEIKGIEVKNATFNDPNISGVITVKNGAIMILVKEDDPYNRKRFTIAHELGHYFLHMQDVDNGGFVDTINMYRSTNGINDENEQAANSFAASLLMNELQVKSFWTDIKSVQTMADIFRVSYDAMAFRLNNLGLL